MKWIKERDALIAQTMAFVQSVTGRKEEFLPTGTPVLLPASAEATSVAASEPAAKAAPGPQNVEPPQPFQLSPPRSAGDVRTEMQSRVANFRKHQERFEREREEYYAETLAKLRASISSGGLRPPSGK